MIKSLSGLLMQTIQNLYASETQMLNELPGIIEKAKHLSLRNGLNHHLSLTTEQKQRLEKIVALINENNADEQVQLNQEHISKGMTGLIEEAKETLAAGLEEDVTDAAIVAAIQKMEHYEISGYGTALAYAHQLHMTKAEALLNETLDEEYEADDLLTALATASLNKEAVHEDIKSVDEGSEDEDTSNNESSESTSFVHINERTINSPGGRAGTSHRRYGTGESRGH
jgi:ferritin-like metal-binding protein YciE